MNLARTAIALPFLLLCSCATVDVEKEVRNAAAGTVPESVLVIPVEIPPPGTVTVTVEKPVYVPYEKETTPPAKPKGADAVRESNEKGIRRPSDYSRAAMVYDYDADWAYEVYTRPLRATDIRLEPGEEATEAPFISDSERWMLGAGVSRENGAAVQHIYVKPVETGLEASLIINTDRRVYHIILRSYREVHMPMVRWRYPAGGMPESYITPSKTRAGAEDAGNTGGADIAPVNPRLLSFGYRITYGLFRKPPWLPKLVYDDGAKTYITFPEDVLRNELPAVFENRKDIVNYRVVDNLVIIDKLVEELTVRMDDTEISITKK